ncbi:hypothetical protein PVL29_023184 [Vitis rotundifolia]|uniref:Uncharacterized protein n=1 Tax=Vitis rotundifolia TaxID=103349 RepID=A0AA38YN59_VITRO|nr:hypothetical protein PVL29_023184 [Vitis rotundifolia]
MSSEEAPAETVLERRVREPKEENATFGPTRDLVRTTGGMKEKTDGDESSPYAVMPATQDVSQGCNELDVNVLHVKLRAAGGNKTKTLGPDTQSAL